MTVDTKFQTLYPFISCIKSNDVEYVGIIINHDSYVTSIYDIAMIKDTIDRDLFLQLGESWWWESNRKIPINIFLKTEMQPFRFAVKSFNSKDVTVLFGPTVTLNDIIEKRMKRKSIKLVRNIKPS